MITEEKKVAQWFKCQTTGKQESDAILVTKFGN